MNLHEIIEEINNLKNTSKHKLALDIFNLLDNNSALFLTKLDAYDFKSMLSSFENLAYADQKNYSTATYINDFERLHALLLYHLNKIV